MAIRQCENYLYELAYAQGVKYQREQLFPPEAINAERHALEFILGLLLARNPDIHMTGDQFDHFCELGLLYTEFDVQQDHNLQKAA